MPVAKNDCWNDRRHYRRCGRTGCPRCARYEEWARCQTRLAKAIAWAALASIGVLLLAMIARIL